MAMTNESRRILRSHSSFDASFDLNPHIDWMANRTKNFPLLLTHLKTLNFLSSDELNKLHSINKTVTSDYRRCCNFYAMLSERNGWLEPLIKCLLETGNNEVVEHLMDARAKFIMSGSVEEKSYHFDIIAMKRRITQLEEELQLCRITKQDETIESLRSQLRTLKATMEKIQGMLNKSNTEIKTLTAENENLRKEVDAYQNKFLELQATINDKSQALSEVKKVTSRLQIHANPHLTIAEIGTPEEPLDYATISKAKQKEWELNGPQTATLNYQHININVWTLINDLKYFKKLKTLTIKQGRLNGIMKQQRQFSASLPELEEFVLHLLEWKSKWNTNYESFSNSLIFYNNHSKAPDSLIPIPSNLLELVERSSMRLKVNQRSGEVIISGLEFVDDLLRLPNVKKFPLYLLALESCQICTPGKIQTGHLKSLTLINVDISSIHLRVLLSKCPKLEVFQFKSFIPSYDIGGNMRQVFNLDKLPLKNLKVLSLSTVTLMLGDNIEFYENFPIQLESIYFNNCNLEPEIIKNFSHIFNPTKLVARGLAGNEFNTHKFLKQALKCQKIDWIHMSGFDRTPRTSTPSQSFLQMENFLTQAGVPQTSTSFVLVKENNNDWVRKSISKLELKTILDSMNGQSKFIATK